MKLARLTRILVAALAVSARRPSLPMLLLPSRPCRSEAFPLAAADRSPPEIRRCIQAGNPNRYLDDAQDARESQ
jgi:hypothetical protein